jgi:signal transduction histidine kinase
LLNWTDGELTSEQTKQITFIRKAAEELTTMVNDQLDLAKVEAGMIVVRPVPFTIGDLFATLRGMLRPLLINDAVTLSFEEPSGLPPLLTDQNKVAQILRNFITNALKFTEHGSVCVGARLTPVGNALVFSVTDTGIGIAPEDHARIFEEFMQVEGSVQRRVNGTGLGLPLSKKLAELLGGHVAVQSQVGVGSTFSAIIPCVFGRSCPVADG